jgi:ABC-2 type transport system permease protein
MIKFLLEKEFKHLFRNPFLPRLVVMMPIMVMLLMPWVTTLDIKNINIIIVDNDHSSTSERLIRDISMSGNFRLADVTGDYEQAISGMEYGTADVILEIPPNFEKDLTNTLTAPVQISINTVNGTKGSLGGSYLGQILLNF